MSNTAEATPFVVIGGACVLAAGAVAWLCDHSDEDRQADMACKDSRSSHAAEKLTALAVRPPDIDAFLRTAGEQGYRVLRHASHEARLISSNGSRVLARRDPSTGLMELIGRRQDAIQHLVREHVRARVSEALVNKGMTVDVRRMASGEARLVARQRGGIAVTVDVNREGMASVDVSCAKGRECESLVRDVAEAGGLQLTEMRMKEDYFVLPGEGRVVLKP
jgi:hypothetical protein